MKHILNIDLAKIKLDKGTILQVIYNDEYNIFEVKAIKGGVKGFAYTQEKSKKLLSFKEILRKHIL